MSTTSPTGIIGAALGLSDVAFGDHSDQLTLHCGRLTEANRQCEHEPRAVISPGYLDTLLGACPCRGRRPTTGSCAGASSTAVATERPGNSGQADLMGPQVAASA